MFEKILEYIVDYRKDYTLISNHLHIFSVSLRNVRQMVAFWQIVFVRYSVCVIWSNS